MAPTNSITFPFDIDSLSPLDRAYQLLLARGFLVEKHRDHLTLSDNAMVKTKYRRYRSHNKERSDDLSYFIDTIKSLYLGEIDALGRFYPNDTWSISAINHLFSPNHFQEETSIDRWAGKWTHFTRLTGKKLPLYQIDSRIALLVKALSAVGCRTLTSCHGSSNQAAYIQFASSDHHSWFKLLVSKVSEDPGSSYATKSSQCTVYFHPRAGETMHSVWSALISLGLNIYSQRIELRAHKAALLELCKQQSIQRFPNFT